MFMRKLAGGGVTVLACVAAACAAFGNVHNPVAIVKAGPVDDALVQHCKDWAENELAIPVPVVESLDIQASTLDEVAEEAAKHVGPEDLGLVVLYSSTNSIPHHGVYRPEQKVVVINVDAMKAGADDETLRRRMERQVIRGIGVLMGLEWSPNPTSAMAPYTTLEELDMIGRNLDPPWQLKLQQRARALDIPVDSDNPYYMLRNE